MLGNSHLLLLNDRQEKPAILKMEKQFSGNGSQSIE